MDTRVCIYLERDIIKVHANYEKRRRYMTKLVFLNAKQSIAGITTFRDISLCDGVFFVIVS